jgi:Protein of unknown function (DUF2911)
MLHRSIATLTCTLVLGVASFAQGNKPVASPPETATVSLSGHTVTIDYGAPSMRGRKIMGEVVPYDKVWRTGANDATSLTTDVALKVGGTMVPAGADTIYTGPGASRWLLIINKQTKQWGTEYHQEQDLARIPMQSKTLSSPQEKMSITFENTHGSSTELHIRWENVDEYVTVVAQ